MCEPEGTGTVKDTNRFIRDIFIIIWSLLILSQLIRIFKPRLQKQHVIKSLKYVSLSAVGSLAFAYFFSILELTVCHYLRYPFYVFINIAVGGMYLFMFLQLYYTFQHSQYCLSKMMIRTHILLSIIAELFFVIWAILDWSGVYKHWFKQLAVSIAGFVWILNVSHLVFKFNRNLFLVLISHSHTHRTLPQTELPEIERKSTLNKEQNKMLNMMVKHTVLSSMEIALGLSLCFLWGVISFADPGGESSAGSIVRLWLVMLFGVVLTSSMLLSFGKENHLYYPLCRRCDNGCRSCCENLAEKKIRKLAPPQMRPAVMELRSNSVFETDKNGRNGSAEIIVGKQTHTGAGDTARGPETRTSELILSELPEADHHD